MANQLVQTNAYPKGANGLTLPLRTSLDSQDLKKHRAMVAFELEVLAMKLDRFGWERARETPTQDRLIQDWMDTLQDYPLDEIKAGITACLDDRPTKMPHERDVLFQVMKIRARKLIKPREVVENVNPPPTEAEKARINALLAETGFAPKRFPETGEGHD